MRTRARFRSHALGAPAPLSRCATCARWIHWPPRSMASSICGTASATSTMKRTVTFSAKCALCCAQVGEQSSISTTGNTLRIVPPKKYRSEAAARFEPHGAGAGLATGSHSSTMECLGITLSGGSTRRLSFENSAPLLHWKRSLHVPGSTRQHHRPPNTQGCSSSLSAPPNTYKASPRQEVKRSPPADFSGSFSLRAIARLLSRTSTSLPCAGGKSGDFAPNTYRGSISAASAESRGGVPLRPRSSFVPSCRPIQMGRRQASVVSRLG